MTNARKVAATISSKGQLTLPRAVRERLGVDKGDSVEFTLDEQGIHLRPLRQNENPFLTWLAHTPAPAQASEDAREARHAGLSAEERQLLQAGPGARVIRLSELDAENAAEAKP